MNLELTLCAGLLTFFNLAAMTPSSNFDFENTYPEVAVVSIEDNKDTFDTKNEAKEQFEKNVSSQIMPQDRIHLKNDKLKLRISLVLLVSCVPAVPAISNSLNLGDGAPPLVQTGYIESLIISGASLVGFAVLDKLPCERIRVPLNDFRIFARRHISQFLLGSCFYAGISAILNTVCFTEPIDGRSIPSLYCIKKLTNNTACAVLHNLTYNSTDEVSLNNCKFDATGHYFVANFFSILSAVFNILISLMIW